MGKKNKIQPRSLTINMDSKNLLVFDGLVFDMNSQKIMGIKNNETFPLIGKSKLRCNRERDNPKNGGKKVQHESISPNDTTWFNSNSQLLSYDHLIAVDTNTNQFNGSNVSVTAAYHIMPLIFNSEAAYCNARVLALIETWNVRVKPENLGWWQILQALDNNTEKLIGNIGLVVDSDFDNHDGFNSRKKPIVLDYFLPENVTLIYGSDKGGAEHLSTMLIKYCHNLAADLLKNENLVMNIKNLHAGLPDLYSHFRQWNTDNMNLRAFAKAEDKEKLSSLYKLLCKY